jgi:hypothetical protein
LNGSSKSNVKGYVGGAAPLAVERLAFRTLEMTGTSSTQSLSGTIDGF